jgi:hypothetical protein
MTKMLEGYRNIVCGEHHISNTRFDDAVRQAKKEILEPLPTAEISRYREWEEAILARVAAAFPDELK